MISLLSLPQRCRPLSRRLLSNLLVLSITLFVATSWGPSSALAQGRDGVHATLSDVSLSANADWTVGPSEWCNRPATVVATAVDVDGLDESTCEYRVSTDGGGSWGDWRGGDGIEYSSPVSTTVHMTATIDTFVDSATLNRVQFRLADDLAIVEISPQHTVRVDGAAPSAPINLAATPGGWTSTDSFDLAWTNPADLTGIVKAFYKVGSPPGGPADWTGRVDGVGVARIDDIVLGAHGARSVYVWLEDAMGNRDHTQYAQVDLLLDQIAPTSPSFLAVSPATWSATNAFDLTWTNPGVQDAPIHRALIKFDSAPGYAGDYDLSFDGAGIDAIADLSAPYAGEVACFVWIEDQAGNADYTAAAGTMLYYAGNQPPEAPQGLTLMPSDWTSVDSFRATWTNPSSPSGICRVWYRWGSPPSYPTDGTSVAGQDLTELTDLQVGGEGQTYLYLWLEDCGGNIDHTRRSGAIAYLDQTPPETTHDYDPPMPASGWFVADVTVQLQAADLHSSVAETLWGANGGLARPGTSFVATDHDIVYKYWSVDIAGNAEAPHSITVPIDREPPTSTLSVSLPEPASGWYAEPVTIVITAADKLSGWTNDTWYQLDGSDWIKGTTFDVSSNGVHSIVYYSRDRAGNYERSPYKTHVVRVDTEAPLVSAYADKTGEYVQTPVVITIDATDQHSDIRLVEYRQQGTAAWTEGSSVVIPNGAHDGTYTYQFRAKDAAGNMSLGSITVRIDTTSPGPPQNTAASPGDWVAENGGFGLSWANPGDVSGISGVYYQVDVDPATNATPAKYVPGVGITTLSDLSVASQGEHTVYVWLRDGAGNSDPFSRTAIDRAFRLDQTPPSVSSVALSGPEGDNGYYTGPVSVTMAADDGLCGVGQFRYRTNSGAWTAVTVTGQPKHAEHMVVIHDDGRHFVEYKTRDCVGNESAISSATIYLDSQAPGAPQFVSVTPAGWTASNNFTLSWANPDDYAGVAGVWIKKGAPPVAADDGEFHPRGPTETSVSGITVDGEGENDVYLWLEDRAGNVDKAQASTTLLRYDVTPPTTSLLESGATRNNYYIGPVALSFQAEDNASGVVGTYYRINDAPSWTLWSGGDIVLDREGGYTVQYYSVDGAKNIESAPFRVLPELDLYPPTSDAWVQTDYVGVKDRSLQVHWSGADTASGVAKWDVQYRRGGCGHWVNWRMDTANLTDSFRDFATNSFYYFRSRAKDEAGWVGNWSVPTVSTYAYSEALGNADFGLGALGAWVSSGELGASVVEHIGHDGTAGPMARLSKAQWGDDDEFVVDEVPVDAYGSIRQTVALPSRDCDQGLILAFWYKIEGFDTWEGKVEGGDTPDDPSDDVIGYIDTFEMFVKDVNGSPLTMLLRDGNPEKPPENPPYPVRELPWRQALLDLTPWAGQTVQIELIVHNRVDEWYPTWVYVDDVRLLPAGSRVMALPLVRTDSSGVGTAHLQTQPTVAPRSKVRTGEKTPPLR